MSAQLPFHIAYRENRKANLGMLRPSSGDQILYVQYGAGRFCAKRFLPDGRSECHIADVYPGTVIKAGHDISYCFMPFLSQELRVKETVFH